MSEHLKRKGEVDYYSQRIQEIHSQRSKIPSTPIGNGSRGTKLKLTPAMRALMPDLVAPASQAAEDEQEQQEQEQAEKLVAEIRAANEALQRSRATRAERLAKFKKRSTDLHAVLKSKGAYAKM